jgi:hypothetical protein
LPSPCRDIEEEMGHVEGTGREKDWGRPHADEWLHCIVGERERIREIRNKILSP